MEYYFKENLKIYYLVEINKKIKTPAFWRGGSFLLANKDPFAVDTPNAIRTAIAAVEQDFFTIPFYAECAEIAV